mmetsp:Transcript_87938/g.121267  ORF Transcript_87938/g.121267 Transcript_87938/m.121267 type:complete len:161 (-) Transcript_87938:81-563(-)
MVQVCEELCSGTEKKIAFLSTPSIYFSLKDKAVKGNAKCFDFDEKFGAKDTNFVFYDFNKNEDIPEQYHKYFDMVVIDPPFITREVWEKYTEATRILLKDNTGQIFLSTIDENEEMIKELLDCNRQKFRPSIPNLVYQYSFYANFETEGLSQNNPEIPEF